MLIVCERGDTNLVIELLEINQEVMETSRKKRRFETFHREEKIALINAVRNKSCIWDTKYYYDQNAIRRAWESVGAELGKDGIINLDIV